MKVLVTGSSGHLGEGLIRHLDRLGIKSVGLDIKSSAFTRHVGSITDPEFIDGCLQGVDAIIHAATLHKPHVGTHNRQAFVDTNISGTLNLLEAAVNHEIQSFIYTSTTSSFGDVLRPAPGDPAVWVTETLPPQPKNIYGVTKLAAENLCRMFSRNLGLPCIVLRTSRFFPEDDDNRHKRDAFDDDNLKLNELLFRPSLTLNELFPHCSKVKTTAARWPNRSAGKVITTPCLKMARTPWMKRRRSNAGTIVK